MTRRPDSRRSRHCGICLAILALVSLGSLMILASLPPADASPTTHPLVDPQVLEPWAKILATLLAIVTGLYGLLHRYVIRPALDTLHEVKTQTSNDHSTNLRDDIDATRADLSRATQTLEATTMALNELAAQVTDNRGGQIREHLETLAAIAATAEESRQADQEQREMLGREVGEIRRAADREHGAMDTRITDLARATDRLAADVTAIRVNIAKTTKNTEE